jgi:SAM-dependent methyltransferase
MNDRSDPTLAGDDSYTGVENLEVMAEAVNYNRYLVDLVTSAAMPGCRAIDFGAGAGTFARPVAAAGFDVTCVEPDDHLRGILAREGLAAVAGLVDVPAGSADYAYTLNVLEHIEDDSAALGELFGVLRPGGRLLVYVPAFQVLYTSMDRKVGHHRRYRLKALTDKVRRAGFSLRQSCYADCLGFGAALVYRMLDPGDGRVNSRGLKLYDRYVFPLSRRLDTLLGRWFGKNVLIIAEKPEPGGTDRTPSEPG